MLLRATTNNQRPRHLDRGAHFPGERVVRIGGGRSARYRIRREGPLSLAPVYDMLPMAFAPVRSGELSKERFDPPRPSDGNVNLWLRIAERAERYWNEVAEHGQVSPDFRALAAENAGAIARARKLLL